jgi:iron(III) transport system ATP-binding protein
MQLERPATSVSAAPSVPVAVAFRNVSKAYGKVLAVRDISFSVAPGTLVTLLGPSGCGKTTTLRMIAGLETATRGQIEIAGQDVTGRSAAERDVSMVFQSYALFPHMTVLDNVAYGLVVSGMAKRDAHASAREKLELVGLSGLDARLPSELSGGQQQRVAVARAVVLEPKVLLFDEPLSNLDAKLRRRVRDDIRAIQQRLKLTVVYVTHDQEEALSISDRVIVMANAVIAQDGTPRDLYERPANRFIADFIGDSNIVDATLVHVDTTWGVATLGGHRVKLAHRGVREGAVALALRPHRLTLGPAGGNGLAATVAKATYVGPRMEYEVETGVGPLFVVSNDVASPASAGDAVTVDMDQPGAAIVLSD